jgi:hypothetical protein
MQVYPSITCWIALTANSCSSRYAAAAEGHVPRCWFALNIEPPAYRKLRHRFMLHRWRRVTMIMHWLMNKQRRARPDDAFLSAACACRGSMWRYLPHTTDSGADTLRRGRLDSQYCNEKSCFAMVNRYVRLVCKTLVIHRLHKRSKLWPAAHWLKQTQNGVD